MKICGHQHVREQLDRMVSLPVIPQSFLFSGPRRLGKYLVALEFAEKLTSIPPRGIYVEGGDILVIGRPNQDPLDEAKVMTSISVDDIREASEFCSRFPSTGRYRVVIVDAAERLTASAENALLKILEEPNSTSVIILVTHLPAKLLPTVRSRLFGIAFSPIVANELRASFPDSSVPDFFFSLGLPGLIATATDSPDVLRDKKNSSEGSFSFHGSHGKNEFHWLSRLLRIRKELAICLKYGSQDLDDRMRCPSIPSPSPCFLSNSSKHSIESLSVKGILDFFSRSYLLGHSYVQAEEARS